MAVLSYYNDKFAIIMTDTTIYRPVTHEINTLTGSLPKLYDIRCGYLSGTGMHIALDQVARDLMITKPGVNIYDVIHNAIDHVINVYNGYQEDDNECTKYLKEKTRIMISLVMEDKPLLVRYDTRKLSYVFLPVDMDHNLETEYDHNLFDALYRKEGSYAHHIDPMIRTMRDLSRESKLVNRECLVGVLFADGKRLTLKINFSDEIYPVSIDCNDDFQYCDTQDQFVEALDRIFEESNE